MSMAQTPASPTRLIIVDPGHFHATLLQRDMYPGIAARVSVYSRLGPELVDYINRISLFNTRKDNPTRWELNVRTSDDPMAEMLRDRPGDIVVFTGRNRGKIDRILAALRAGMHVLADKPWIITSADLPKLDEALALAERTGLAGYDIMTERHEVTSELQREFVNAPEVFGRLETGTPENPAVRARSIHHVSKVVAGVPLRRPDWFFDIDEYGEALADVGTHVVDLVQWTAFPDQAVDYRKDIRILAGRHWPLDLTRAQFAQVTGNSQFAPGLASHVTNETLHWLGNNSVQYTLRGVHITMDILWNWETAEGGDVYEATFRGTRARAEIRQGKAEKHIPELYIVPADLAGTKDVLQEVHKKVAALQSRWPGLSVTTNGAEARIVIPDKFRVGHEAHFAEVCTLFFEYMKSPKSIPVWERSAMMAKYFVSTAGVEKAR